MLIEICNVMAEASEIACPEWLKSDDTSHDISAITVDKQLPENLQDKDLMGT